MYVICVYTYTCACVCVRACVRACVRLQPPRILVQYGAVSGAPARVRRDTPRQALATLAMVSAALAVCCALIASSDLRANKTSLMQVRAVGGTRAKSRAHTHAHGIRHMRKKLFANCREWKTANNCTRLLFSSLV